MRTTKVLGAILLSLTVSGVAQAATHSAALTAPRRPVKKSTPAPSLKPLTPQADFTDEPDPSDLCDQAVKEYGAGNLAKAEKLFNQVLELDPLNVDANFNMGAIKEWRNDWAAALNYYRSAQKARPQDKEIAEAIKAVEYKLKNRSAILAQTAKAEKEREIATHSKLAKEAFGSQNFAEAIVHLTYLAAAMPDDPKIQFALGQSLRALKNFDWAAYRLKMAIYLDPDNDLYRKTLVDLDKEMQASKEQAFNESADMALNTIRPIRFIELADIGWRDAQF